jgi:SPASM domain peptide maturase of grasp-with-spasm system
MVFRLFANCIPVRGAKRSTICDLQMKALWIVPAGLYHIVTELKDLSLPEIKARFSDDEAHFVDEYFSFLQERNLGMWTEEPERFPEMNMSWDHPSLITNAIVDIDAASVHDFEIIFSELISVGCKHLQLRWFCTVSIADLMAILVLGDGSILNSFELILPFSPVIAEGEFERLIDDFPRIRSIHLYGAPENHTNSNRARQSMGLIHFVREVVDSSLHCGKIGTDLFSINIETFTEAVHYNSCLNRKIGIDTKGNIKNCPSMSDSFGVVASISLKQIAASPEFQRNWGITKDQIEVCKDCEFRYVCTDCRAYRQDPGSMISKPQKCAYDPYTATWQA